MKRITKLSEVVFLAANFALDLESRVTYNFAQEPTDVPESGLGGWTFTVTVSAGDVGEQQTKTWTGAGADPESAFVEVYKKVVADMNQQKTDARARIQVIEEAERQLELEQRATRDLSTIWPTTDEASAEAAAAADAYEKSPEGLAAKQGRADHQQALAEEFAPLAEAIARANSHTS